MSELTLYANPYDIEAQGFYFSDMADFKKKVKKAKNIHGDPVEEFEIDFINGDDTEMKLFSMMETGQHNIEEYFDAVDEGYDEDDIQRLQILTEDMGYDFNDALDKKDDLVVYGEFKDDEDYAYEFVDQMGGAGELGKETLEQYFDYESFGRDLVLGGDVSKTDEGVYYDPRSV